MQTEIQIVDIHETLETHVVIGFQAFDHHLNRTLLIPDLKFSLSQPRINYRVTDGKPYLAIPSAKGDAFADYEYDFETKVWMHHS